VRDVKYQKKEKPAIREEKIMIKITIKTIRLEYKDWLNCGM
jgi:hypothetical protein